MNHETNRDAFALPTVPPGPRAGDGLDDIFFASFVTFVKGLSSFTML